MPSIERIPAKAPPISGQLTWTVTALGSAYVAYNYVTTEKYKLIFQKINYPLSGTVSQTRMKILLYFVAARVVRQIFWAWKMNSLELTPAFAVQIQLFNFIADLLTITLAARNTSQSPNVTDKIGIALFTIGSLLETGYDYQRAVWKQDPSNAGKPYMESLAKVVVHPNYLGYTLWRVGSCLVSGNAYFTAFVAFAFSYDFIFNAIPGLQEHNKKRYGKVYEDYLAKTWNFIPFLW